MTVLLLLFLAPEEASRPELSTLRAALAEALSAEVRIVPEARPREPAAGLAELDGLQREATLACLLRWHDEARLEALLIARDRSRATERERHLLFSHRDPPLERYRAVGYALAGLLLELRLARPEPATQPPRAPSTPPPARSSETAVPGVREASHVVPGFGFELLAGGDLALAGAGSGIAGSVGLRRQLAGGTELRAAASMRAGVLQDADLSLLAVGASAGVGWPHLMRPAARLCVGPRVSPFIAYESLSRASAGGGSSERHGRLVAGVATAVELRVTISRALALIASGGVAAFFGRTRVVVDGERVATLAPLRAEGELGVLAQF